MKMTRRPENELDLQAVAAIWLDFFLGFGYNKLYHELPP